MGSHWMARIGVEVAVGRWVAIGMHARLDVDTPPSDGDRPPSGDANGEDADELV